MDGSYLRDPAIESYTQIVNRRSRFGRMLLDLMHSVEYYMDDSSVYINHELSSYINAETCYYLCDTAILGIDMNLTSQKMIYENIDEFIPQLTVKEFKRFVNYLRFVDRDKFDDKVYGVYSSYEEEYGINKNSSMYSTIVAIMERDDVSEIPDEVFKDRNGLDIMPPEFVYDYIFNEYNDYDMAVISFKKLLATLSEDYTTYQPHTSDFYFPNSVFHYKELVTPESARNFK